VAATSSGCGEAWVELSLKVPVAVNAGGPLGDAGLIEPTAIETRAAARHRQHVSR